jgi:hypothetical protein
VSWNISNDRRVWPLDDKSPMWPWWIGPPDKPKNNTSDGSGIHVSLGTLPIRIAKPQPPPLTEAPPPDASEMVERSERVLAGLRNLD